MEPKSNTSLLQAQFQIWLELLRRPINQVRLLALLGLAALATVLLIAALHGRRYALADFQSQTEQGWADLWVVGSPDLTVPDELQDTGVVVSRYPIYRLNGVEIPEEEGPDLGPAREGDGPTQDSLPIPTNTILPGTRPVLIDVPPAQLAAMPTIFRSHGRAAQLRTHGHKAWVAAGWARDHSIKIGDTISVTLEGTQWTEIALEVSAIGDFSGYLYADVTLMTSLTPGELPPPSTKALVARVGAERFLPTIEQIEQRSAPQYTNLMRVDMGSDVLPLTPYDITTLLAEAFSAIAAQLALLIAGCAAWLAASLYRRGRMLPQRAIDRAIFTIQIVLLLWFGVALGGMLAYRAPHTLRYPPLGLVGTPVSDGRLAQQGFMTLMVFMPLLVPGMAHIRAMGRLRQFGSSRLGNELRAGLIGSVVLIIEVGLALYAGLWWHSQPLLLFNLLAALAIGTLGSIGPLAVFWNNDQHYRRASRSAVGALFACLLVTLLCTALVTLLANAWITWRYDLPMDPLSALGNLAALVAVAIVALILALILGPICGVLVVAFRRGVTGSLQETLSEQAVRLEGLLLLVRLVFPVLASLFITSTSGSPLISMTVNFYLFVVTLLLVLLRRFPQRVLLWSMLSALFDAATISMLIAADGGIASAFYDLYFLALLTVTMRFGPFLCLGLGFDYIVLYLVAVLSAEDWQSFGRSPADQQELVNRLLLIGGATLLAALMARERQRGQDRLERANKRLLADEGLRRELEIARRIQQNLFPQELPTLPGVRLAATSLPARETGGDFFDVLEVGVSGLALVVGDVSGKSIPAAMVMAMAYSALRAEILDDAGTPAQVLRKANLTLQGAGKGTFTATQYALLDGDRRMLTLANAGQMAPILLRSGHAVLVSTGGPAFPLGIVERCAYEEREIPLEPGDMLLFYTDGIVEAMNARREMYGFDRLLASIERIGPVTPELLLHMLLTEINGFVGATEQHDDMTMVAVQVAPEPGWTGGTVVA